MGLLGKKGVMSLFSIRKADVFAGNADDLHRAENVFYSNEGTFDDAQRTEKSCRPRISASVDLSAVNSINLAVFWLNRSIILCLVKASYEERNPLLLSCLQETLEMYSQVGF